MLGIVQRWLENTSLLLVSQIGTSGHLTYSESCFSYILLVRHAIQTAHTFRRHNKKFWKELYRLLILFNNTVTVVLFNYSEVNTLISMVTSHTILTVLKQMSPSVGLLFDYSLYPQAFSTLHFLSLCCNCVIRWSLLHLTSLLRLCYPR